MYKVYFENRLLKISGQSDQEQNYCLLYKYNDPDKLSDTILKFFGDRSQKCINIYSENLDELWSLFRERFHFLEASGGIVLNEKKEMLLINRYRRWDAPKGHFEPCETPEICARREILEECGIKSGGTLAELSPSYHIYKFEGEYYLKMTHWFLFGYKGPGSTTPQNEEGITRAEWIDREALNELKENMWHSVQDVISEVTEKHLPYL